MASQDIVVGDVFKVWTCIDGEALYKVAIVDKDWIHFRNAERELEPLSRMSRKEFVRLFQKVTPK